MQGMLNTLIEGCSKSKQKHFTKAVWCALGFKVAINEPYEKTVDKKSEEYSYPDL